MRREDQPSPVPHKSKEVDDCLLYSYPSDDGDPRVGHVHKKIFMVRRIRDHMHAVDHVTSRKRLVATEKVAGL